MGCKNCNCIIEKETEISSPKIDKINPLIEDLENKEKILLSKQKSSNGEKIVIPKILKSNSKKLNQMQNEQFNLEVFNEINKFRIKHGVEELIIDEKINNISQKYSQKLARESELELSGNKYKGKDLGEIIFCCKDDISPKDLVDIWYNNGSKNYNYKSEEQISNNFTQMIWKSSKLFGIGHSLTRKNKLYIVANFFPEGNVKGQFLKNVFPVKEKSEDSSFYSFTTTFLEEALFSHNELRAKHNSPALILNPTLSSFAQKHSEMLANKGKIEYSNNKFENQKIGENLFMSKTKCSGEEVTSYWYKGINHYNFENINENKNNEEINNFTQLIWKNTKEVGFGYSIDKKGNFYAVANYFPCGNIKGQYQNNVLPD